MENPEAEKTDLINVVPVVPNPLQKGPCERIKSEVNKFLIEQCAKKFNRLRKCTTCDIVHKDWPIINSPMDARLLNTAFDGVNGSLALSTPTNVVTDLHWEVGKWAPNLNISNDPNNYPTNLTDWIPAIVNKCTAWITSPFANANWISLYKDTAHYTDPVTNVQEDHIDVYFRYRFYLNSFIDISQFVLDMDFYADNSVHEIYINKIKQSPNSPLLLPQDQLVTPNEYHFRGFESGKQVHISLANDWQLCENEIVVHVKSGPGYIGFLAQNSTNCYEAKFPKLAPIINISWGDSVCDCIETDDTEIMCITVCNGYSNVIFKNFVIGRITVVLIDDNGNEIPVPLLPDGTPSVGLHPIGPYCFGDIAACNPNGNNCVSREFVLINRGAKSGKYRIKIEGICFEVCHGYALNDCFEYIACYS
jgi:hypothetical protein